MGVSKVDYNGETLIDLTGDTVTPETLAEGATAHDMAGNPITGTMKQGGGESNTMIVNLVISLSASGLSVSLPQGTTYSSIDSAISNNIHVVCVMEIPSFAGSMAGTYAAPFTKKNADGSLCFSTTNESALQYFKIETDGSIFYGIHNLEKQDNKVTSLTVSATHTQYPSAKAVYDIVSRNSTIVIDVLGEADAEGYLYLDEATELQIYSVAGTGQPAVIRYRESEGDQYMLLHHMGYGIFTATLVMYNMSAKASYDRSKLALRVELFAHTENSTAAASTYGTRRQEPTFNDYVEALRQSAIERGLLASD